MDRRKQVEELAGFARDIRIRTLGQFGELGFGHVGGSLSVADLLAVLYGAVMRFDPGNPRLEGRDQLIMSKGHAGPAVYATLALKGFFPVEKLATLNRRGTSLPSHCDRNKTPGIDMTTGSLGQGLSSAVGIALAGRLKKDGSYTFCVIGDGECDEGQIWEAALFAGHNKVSNLIAFVDHNKLQLDGPTAQICDLGDIRAKFAEFGWFAQDADGHDIGAILDAIDRAKAQTAKPSMIVLHTTKGKGAEFAEAAGAGCHHMDVARDVIDKAIAKLAAAKEGK